MAHSSYPGSPGSLASIADKIKTFLAQPEHDFWPDDVSLLDPSLVRSGRLTSSRQVTDIYLLALAASRGGVLATFDQRLFTDAVVEGARALHRIA